MFDRLGLRTIRDLRRLGPDVLRHQLGQQGEHFWNLAHGLDDRPVVPDREAKSISHETTFAADISDLEALRAWLLELTEHVGRRLRRHKLQGRTIHVKVRFADFRTRTRSRTLSEPTDVTRDIWRAASELLSQALPTHSSRVRLLGVGVSGFVTDALVQRMLFDDEDRANQRQLDTAADAVRAKFGAAALGRASGLLHRARHRQAPRPGEPDEPSSAHG
jgi:DNA polymerase-4